MSDTSKGIAAGRRMFDQRKGSKLDIEPSAPINPDEPRPRGTVETGRALYEKTHPKNTIGGTE